MQRALILFTLLSALLSACGSAITPDSGSAKALEQEIETLPTVDDTVTLPPSPTTALVATNTAIVPRPTEDPVCNAAELVDRGYRADAGGEIAKGGRFTMILRLANVGTCTWTNGFSLVPVVNQGLDTIGTQKINTTAIPGQIVDLEIRLTAPDKPGCFSAAWKLQDAEGDTFGYGQNASRSFALGVAVVEEEDEVDLTYCLTPAEGCWNAITQSELPRFARLKHDPQWMPWPSRMADPDWNRGFHYDWYPETVPLWTNPKGGDGRLPYSKAWLGYLRAIQPNDDAAVWIARVAAGLFNRGNDFIPILNLNQLTKEPIGESISSGGNVVRVLEIKNNSARIEMLFSKYSPPDPAVVNYQTRPWLVTKFTSVSIDGGLGNAGGIDVYFPNLARQEEGYWVEMKRVEMFPEAPFCAVVEEFTNVMASPSRASGRYGVFSPGQRVMVHEYRLVGSDVWGKIKEGWIPLVFQEDGQPIYPTSWEMETRPPIYFD